MFGNMVLFDFNKDCVISSWEVVNDLVMGGRSSGHIEINQDGNAVFHGRVSLENNGGFSMVRYRFKPKDIANYDQITIRLMGDGKPYQFRVKSNREQRHSYIHHFRTTGDWQTIEIPLAEMEPFYRGKKLDTPNYESAVLGEIAFLVGNKRAETFRLEIDHIVLGSSE